MTPSPSTPNPSSIHGHKLDMAGSRFAYLPGIISKLIRDQAAKAPVPGHRWPLGRIQPGQPVPDYEAANDDGPAPFQPGPVVA